MSKTYVMPYPILNNKELQEYEKLTEPGRLSQLTDKAGKLVLEKIKDIAGDISGSITERELFKRVLELSGSAYATLKKWFTNIVLVKSRHWTLLIKIYDRNYKIKKGSYKNQSYNVINNFK